MSLKPIAEDLGTLKKGFFQIEYLTGTPNFQHAKKKTGENNHTDSPVNNKHTLKIL